MSEDHVMEFAIDQSSEEEVRERLSAACPDARLVRIRGAKLASSRQPRRMDAQTYFVVAFSAHLLASSAHEGISHLIAKAFADKNGRTLARDDDSGEESVD